VWRWRGGLTQTSVVHGGVKVGVGVVLFYEGETGGRWGFRSI